MCAYRLFLALLAVVAGITQPRSARARPEFALLIRGLAARLASRGDVSNLEKSHLLTVKTSDAIR